jgi:outer membrane protein W
LGGEVRYLFERNDIRLTSGGASYNFASQNHLIHYDVLIHAGSVESRVRPFVAAGAGIRGFIGTGQEHAVQPLSQFAILSRTNQWQPVLSVGGGIKWVVGKRMIFRVEVRDYISPVPSQVIVPGVGTSFKGWLHNLTPIVGIGYSF